MTRSTRPFEGPPQKDLSIARMSTAFTCFQSRSTIARRLVASSTCQGTNARAGSDWNCASGRRLSAHEINGLSATFSDRTGEGGRGSCSVNPAPSADGREGRGCCAMDDAASPRLSRLPPKLYMKPKRTVFWKTEGRKPEPRGAEAHGWSM